jgi:hypothetical protein
MTKTFYPAFASFFGPSPIALSFKGGASKASGAVHPLPGMKTRLRFSVKSAGHESVEFTIEISDAAFIGARGISIQDAARWHMRRS